MPWITRSLLSAITTLSFLLINTAASAVENRFPSPEFESGYQMPIEQYPMPRAQWLEFLDIGVLLAALSLAAWLALKARSRLGLYLLTLFTVLYFGFFRQGCICPIGAIQNVTLGLTQSTYLLPIAVLLFFSLPLIFALFFGRVFCSSVCPLGAIQELFILKPLRLPKLVSFILGLIPFFYLAFAVLFTITGSGFLICRFDPFIGLYRLSGPVTAFILAGLFLLIGLFIARPYCRFFCPYGILLGLGSFFSRQHLRITPADCIQCGLCASACPNDCINPPTQPNQQSDRNAAVKNLARWLLLMPVLMLLMGLAFSQLTDVLARFNPTVQLADQIYQQERGEPVQSSLTSQAFRQQQQSLYSLYQTANQKRSQFKIGLWIIGLLLGLIIAMKLIRLNQQIQRSGYEPDRFHCVSCGRCMEYCPVTTNGMSSNKG